MSKQTLTSLMVHVAPLSTLSLIRTNHLYPDENIVDLVHLPSYILVNTHHTTRRSSSMCNSCHTSIKIIYHHHDGKWKATKLYCQMSLVSYDRGICLYRLVLITKGQTIPFILVDIALPPMGGLSLFNLYIALS
jgi:hypothetical protein